MSDVKAPKIVHRLKSWPRFFEAVRSGEKTFEYRINDRGFQKGDIIVLCEWDPALTLYHTSPQDCEEGPKGYTDRQMAFEIGFILPVPGACVILSLINPQDAPLPIPTNETP